MYYILRSFGYEYEYQYILEGPKVQHWEDYCNSLIDEAVELAIKKAKKVKWKWYLDTGHIFEALFETLKKKGYQQIEFDSYSLCTEDIQLNEEYIPKSFLLSDKSKKKLNKFNERFKDGRKTS